MLPADRALRHTHAEGPAVRTIIVDLEDEEGLHPAVAAPDLPAEWGFGPRPSSS